MFVFLIDQIWKAYVGLFSFLPDGPKTLSLVQTN
jgi:hypothetical protein